MFKDDENICDLLCSPLKYCIPTELHVESGFITELICMLKKMLLPLLCCLLAMNTLTAAQAAQAQEGRHYTQLAKPV